MNINTVKTMNMASTAYAKELEDTKNNMLAKLAAIGISGDKENIVKNRKINKTFDKGDDVLIMSINGVELFLQRGATYNVPKEIDTFLENIGE